MVKANKCERLKPGGRQPNAGTGRIKQITQRKPEIEDGGRYFKASGADNGTS
jgi:hypothetical protein